ncbi:MAG: hypothetical protein Q8922_09520 [Bacteroidota bacterium]|nr:hypothetical protein [Bacteroidota bacterium]MDP4234431.1 hypothetical protein [Bacteroidota bacterium]MDP4243997.1 hypothetical protein [Bacteroidota bacterium]MDP4288163.1 hypothetical protein [Bacteroidota bacterium]
MKHNSSSPGTVARPSGQRFGVTLSICAIIYLPSLFWTLGLDQNIFAEIASLLLRGKTLYVDAWDVKPPNIFYTYALFEWIFGQHEFAVRLSDYLFTLLACSALFVGVDRQASVMPDRLCSWAAPIATVLLALTLLSLGLSDTAQTESYSLFFIIAGAVLAFQNRTLLLLLGGVAIGNAAFYKTTNTLFLVSIAIEIVLLHKGRAVRPLLLIAAGFILWCILQFGLLAWQGSLAEYLSITFNVFQHHSQEVSQFRPMDLIRTIWIYANVWLLLALAASVLAAVRKDWSFFRSVRLPVMFLLAGLLAVALQNKGWGYQYVIVLPGLVASIGLALAYGTYKTHWTNGIRTHVVTALLCAVAFAVSPSIRRAASHTRESTVALRDRDRYLASLGQPHSLYYPPGTEALSAYIQSHTAATDRVFIFGEEPGAYWRSGREPATRFVYALLFTSGVIPSGDLAAIGDTIAGTKPRLVIVERYDTLMFRGRPETSVSLLESDTIFRSLAWVLKTEYAAADTVRDNFIIYRRKD